MPHASLKLTAGVNQNRTPALNEAAISTSQLIRFVPDEKGLGLPQKLGGWLKYPNSLVAALGSIVRNLWAWSDINDKKHLAIGAEAFLGVITDPSSVGSSIALITPRTYTVDVPVHVETVQGSYIVTITDGNNFSETSITASGDGVTAILTFAGPLIFPVGSTINVSGLVPSGYNGNWTVETSSSTSVSYGNTNNPCLATGVQTTPGTIINTSNITNYDVVDIKTQISAGGLVLFGTYQCYQETAYTYQIIARDVLGEPTNALFTTATISVTGASGDTTTATLTYSTLSDEIPAVGSLITVTGVDPAGYNGVYIVTASSATTVSYLSAEDGMYVSGGTIEDYGTVPLFDTVADSPIVTVTLPFHGLAPGDAFPLLVLLELNQITLFGIYNVIEVLDVPVGGPSAQFTIQGATRANATTTTSVPLNEGNARYTYYIGLSQPPLGAGFGVGAFGGGPFGYGVTPAIPTGEPITASDWTLDNWGSILISCPIDAEGIGGAIYTWDPVSNQQNATIIPEAPIVNDGIFVAMPQRQIIAWGSTFTGIQDHLLVRWCDVENYNQWIGLPQNQAGSYRIPKGSRIIQGLQAAQQGLLWTDTGVWSMQYIGQPYIYSFNEIGTGCGLIARKGACSMNGVVYWMSQSQFYHLTGNGVEVIYCPIWDVIFQDLDTTHLEKIRVAPNSRFGEISWFYPTISNGGEINAYVKYNVNLRQWDYGTLSRTAWINQSVLGAPIGAGADTVTGAQYLYQHEFRQTTQTPCLNDDVYPMVSNFTTGYFVLNEAEDKMFVDQVWPDMKWGFFGGAQSADVILTFYVTDYPSVAPVAYPFALSQNMNPEYVTPRFRSRLLAIGIESSDIDSFWRLGNIRYRLQPDGKF